MINYWAQISLETESSKAEKLENMFFNQRFWLTKTIIAVNFLIYYYVYSHGGITDENLIAFGANYRPLVMQGEWWRLMSCMFLHANLMHIGANMYSLWALGRMLEALVGWKSTFLVYMVTGVLASLTSVVYHTDAVIGIGASGAIFGLFGAFATLVLKKKVVGAGGQLLSIKSLMAPLLINLGISLLPDIDLSAHLGGFVSGAMLGLLLN
jgi:rhomboid protease GluP